MAHEQDITAYQTLGSDINKRKADLAPEAREGIVSQKLPELVLNMPNADIVALTNKWEKEWTESAVKSEWETFWKDNENYWLNKQFDVPRASRERTDVDNVIFESLETYLPKATRRNPEPLVALAHGEERTREAEAYVTKVRDKLADLADTNKLRLKLKKSARHWAIYLLGVAKLGWDLDKDTPTVRIVRPQRMILDPNATIDEDGYTGERIGEYRKLTASRILAIVGEAEEGAEARKALREAVKDDLATLVQFVEWWTPQYMCWKFKSHILFKKKNPHWNYDVTEARENVDQYGNVTTSEEETQGANHFPVPRMPYEFLSVFNLGDQPTDNTSIIGQNLANQDRVNKRNRQIDKNADRMNGGMVVSLERSGLTEPQAKKVSEALRKGGVVAIPTGAPRDAIDDYQPTALPADVFADRNDIRSRIRDIFGTTGSTPAGIRNEDTVRGKIIVRALDDDRIGGGVSEYLEQLADNIYNWFVQLLYVYDADFQLVQGAVAPRITVSVKEGSLLPKDSVTIANQAIELATNGKMALVDLYERLEYPNPEELAANVWLEQNAPDILYANIPAVQQAIQLRQQAQAAAQQAQAQQEAQKSQQEHAQEMEKEAMKAEAKGSGMPQLPQLEGAAA